MYLRKAVYNDWPLLLDWRNDYSTRSNCQDDYIVEEEGHKKWLRLKLAEPGFEIYVAISNNIPVGTIRSEPRSTDGMSKVSWMIGPEYRNRGFGLEMVRLYISKLDEKIKIEIKKGDIYSQKIVGHLNLIFTKEQDGKLHYSK